MKIQLGQLGHYLVAILFSGVYFVVVKLYLHNEAQICLALGIFGVVLGVWGNKAKLVIIRVPWDQNSYKIINYILMTIGVMMILYSGYLFSQCDFTFAC
jgi:hypothetical protein